MCCISESEKAKRAERGGSRYDLNLFHFFNHRLTLIPHISGLSTQWRVHMASFSEMHPNPTSEPYSLHTRAHTRTANWCRAGLGLSGLGDAVFRSQGPLWSSLEHHTSTARQNHLLFLAQHFAPQMHSCLLVFLAKAAACFVLRHSARCGGELPLRVLNVELWS